MTDPVAERAADLFVKQERIAALLRETGRDGLLVLDPANFAWLTAGAVAKGVVNPAERPCLFFQGPQRWVVCCNADTQRLFDEELDGLGFQLKEWPWQWGRAQLLADLCHGKRIACDVPFSDCENVGERLTRTRWTLTDWEQARLKDLGRAVAHAVEATCRNAEPGESEEEIAGQLGHRLAHHGMAALALHVMADDRQTRYRRGGATEARVQRHCVVQTTAQKWGLHVTASRTVSFGPPADAARTDHEVACRHTAVQVVSSTVRTKAAEILAVGERILQMDGREHEWRATPTGWLTGFMAVEWVFVPTDAGTVLEPGHAVVWQGGVGGALNADTVLVADAGPQIVTVPENWPVKRIKIGGATVDRPDTLVRS